MSLVPFWKRRLIVSRTFLLSFIYASLFCVSTIAIIVGTYTLYFNYQNEQTDNRITEDLNNFVNVYTSNRSQQVPEIARIGRVINNFANAQLRTDPSMFLLANREGVVLAGNLSHMPKGVTFDQEGWFDHVVLVEGKHGKQEEHPFRGRALELLGTNGHILLVGRDIYDQQQLQHKTLNILLWSVVFIIVLAFVGAWWISKIVSRRLAKINNVCEAVMAGDLTPRVTSDQSGDEFDELSLNINRMLAFIQSLMDGIRCVSDNIAHDLRTPLTRLRHSLDKLVRQLAEQPGNGKESREMAAQAIAEADDLLKTFNSLLRIVKLENSASDDSFQAIQAIKLIEDVIDAYEPLAEEKNISLSKLIDDEQAWIFVDRDSVRQALANLMDNAIKYTDVNGYIQIRAGCGKVGYEFVIADSGPGIPPEWHEEVQKRFVRLDGSERSTPGNGLGLSLVAAVAQMHNAKLKFNNTYPGLEAKLGEFRIVQQPIGLSPM